MANDIKIIAGIHTLDYNLSTKELIKKLSSNENILTKITIPEGKRVEQIAAMLEDKKIFGYKEILSAAEGYEGKLFPDTYYISRRTKAQEFVEIMVNNFNKKTSEINFSQDDLILASIIEREAIKNEERPIIAGIFKNRLEINMKLEADPTVLYVNDSQKIVDITPQEATQYTFWQPIDFSLYRSLVSPYNTYLNQGLPPYPICSPGLSSIEAAINSIDSDYLFFLHGSDGQLHPALNNDEHEINKDLYL